MLQTQYPNAFTEGKGTIKLMCRAFVLNANIEAEILETNAESQTATIRRPGRLPFVVHFRNIQNVCLKYADGEVIENFGPPKVNKPESIAYIQHQAAAV